MYLQHFGLRQNPFDGSVDPRNFHPTRSHRGALDALVAALRDRHSPVLVEGPKGCGKTMLLRALAASLPEAQQMIVVEAEARRRGGPWPALEAALGLRPTRDERSSDESVRAHLRERSAAAGRLTVAFDDTHNLPDYWIEQIDAMTADAALELAVVLAAETDFGAVSRSPAAERVRERFQARIRIEPIAESECRGYLEALLMAAGCREPRIFSEAAIQWLHAESAGLPARLGALADRALLVAYGRGLDRVDDRALEEASRQLQDRSGAAPKRSTASPARGSATAPLRPVVEPLRRPEPEAVRKVEPVRNVEPAEQVADVEAIAAQGGARLAVGGGYPIPSHGLHQLRADGSSYSSGAGGPAATGANTWGSAPGSSMRSQPAEPAVVTPFAGNRTAGEPQTVQEGRWQQDVLAGIPRPDRPRWDRAKHDPYRNPVPEDPPFGPEGLPVVSDPHGEAAEWFRVLRLGLEDWMEQAGGSAHSILVTSSGPEAGKTFVATNLALLFANEPEIRVLLVDANMRRPRFEGLFGVPSRPGLADVLAGRAELSESINFISEVGLQVMTAGRSGNPRDLVSSDRFEGLLRQMKAEAELVIIDAPPLDPWVDARAMAAAADGVLLVARAGKSRAAGILQSVRSLDGGNLIGAVLTGVDGLSSRRNASHRRPRS